MTSNLSHARLTYDRRIIIFNNTYLSDLIDTSLQGGSTQDVQKELARSTIREVVVPTLKTKRETEITSEEDRTSTSAVNAQSRIRATSHKFIDYLKGEFHKAVQETVESKNEKIRSIH